MTRLYLHELNYRHSKNENVCFKLSFLTANIADKNIFTQGIKIIFVNGVIYFRFFKIDI